jgi:hypothetical protein
VAVAARSSRAAGVCASSTPRSWGTKCERSGPDVGGGAVRALSHYHALPVEVTGSRFTANVCSNGGARSSIGVSWNVAHSRFVANRAIGHSANPSRPGTPGGGSGGAIYNDGNRFRLTIRAATWPATTRPRAAVRSSSSATTAAARSRSRTASCSAIEATDFRPPVCPASSSWAPAGPRSSTPCCAERERPSCYASRSAPTSCLSPAAREGAPADTHQASRRTPHRRRWCPWRPTRRTSPQPR